MVGAVQVEAIEVFKIIQGELFFSLTTNTAHLRGHDLKKFKKGC